MNRSKSAWNGSLVVGCGACSHRRGDLCLRVLCRSACRGRAARCVVCGARVVCGVCSVACSNALKCKTRHSPFALNQTPPIPISPFPISRLWRLCRAQSGSRQSTQRPTITTARSLAARPTSSRASMKQNKRREKPRHHQPAPCTRPTASCTPRRHRRR